jgi:major vault protein
MDEMRREHKANDLALPPNEYAFVLDTTKGQVQTYTGPIKASLSQTDQPVIFDMRTKRFEECDLHNAKQVTPIAPEGWYIVLYNPASDKAENEHPPMGSNQAMPKLAIGQKINIPGPVSFAPWPGQMVRVLQGHHLRRDQYLMVRVYNEQAAEENWESQILKPRSDEGDSDVVVPEKPDLTVGKLLVIKGTEASFYIPPTGLEVVRDEHDNYVREAVTLEQLEYCLLLDQNGEKRFVRGPAVVFPEPTEEFVAKGPARKMRAIELNPNSGIHVKVIADYTDGDREYKEGEELFITGAECAVYFPRKEHAIIKYGEQEVHYGIAIPEGEGRYVLDREGDKDRQGDDDFRLVRNEVGPQVFLPDPRKDVIVIRTLSIEECELMYPGNNEALHHNMRLLAEQGRVLGDGKVTNEAMPAAMYMASAENLSTAMEAEDGTVRRKRLMRRVAAAPATFHGDDFVRKTQYTPPRTVTLDTKYDGVVTMCPFDGYAIMLVDKQGHRRVVEGPDTVMLAYDETPHKLSLSTGKPKNTDNLHKTVYLRVKHNYVTDIIFAETQDGCTVEMKLSFKVNFEGDPQRWFSVENYVKFLCDHMRSVIRSYVKKVGVEEFYQNATDMLRDLILGKSEEGKKRPGKKFDENGMRIYDVEVLKVSLDQDIQDLLVDQQRDVIRKTLEVARSRRNLEFTRESEAIKRSEAQEVATTKAQNHELRRKEIADIKVTKLAEVASSAEVDVKNHEARVAVQELIDAVDSAERARDRAREEQDIAMLSQRNDLSMAKMRAEAEAVKAKAEAISEKLIAALQSLGDAELVGKVTEAVGRMHMLEVVGGDSISETFAQIFAGTKLAERAKLLMPKNGGNDGSRPIERR